MFNESYYIFSVGNVKPIWREQYPSCWKVRLIEPSSVSAPAHACGEIGSPCLLCLRGLCVSAHAFTAPAAASCADAQLLKGALKPSHRVDLLWGSGSRQH